MAETPRRLMLIGAAAPHGRLAASIAAAADAVRREADDIEVDIMNLAETAIDTCDGRPLDGYGAETRWAVDRIAAAAAVLIAAPVYRANFPTGTACYSLYAARKVTQREVARFDAIEIVKSLRSYRTEICG